MKINTETIAFKGAKPGDLLIVPRSYNQLLKPQDGIPWLGLDIRTDTPLPEGLEDCIVLRVTVK